MSIVHKDRRVALAVTAVLGSVSTFAYAASPTIDGTRDTDYKSSLSTQTIDTGFGDNSSELDAVYARIAGGKLHLFIAGNIESNSNKMEVFFDTKAGGQNVLLNNNPSVDFNQLNDKLAGLTFDSGFSPDHYVTYNRNTTDVFVSYSQLNTAGGGNGGYLGSILTPSQQGAGTVSGSGVTVDLGYSDANTGGIAGATGSAADTAAAEAVTTGAEIAIDLAQLNITGDLKLSILINGGNHDFLSNQALGGLPVGTINLGGDGANNYTGTVSGVNYNNFAGDQFLTVSLGNASNAWNIDGSGNWGLHANWDIGAAPNASGDFAYFGPAITAAQTINVEDPQTVGGIIFNNSNKYTIAGANPITIDTPSTTALVIVNSGSHDITAPLALNKDTLFNINGATNKLKVTNLSASTAGVAKSGDGTLEINTLKTSGALTVNGGTLEITANGGSSGVVSVGAVTAVTGKIDLHDNDLVSDYGAGPSNYTSIFNAVKSGLALLGGTDADLNSVGDLGIGSTEVDLQTISGTVLAVVDDGDPNLAGGITSISGYTIPNPTTSVLVKYTWFGDCNLDGVVDGSDYALADTGFTSGGSLTGWVFGDMNFDGIVTGEDYALVDTGFIAQSGVLPEPTTLGLIGLGCAGLIRRRRK